MGGEEIRQRPIELAVEEIVSNFRDAGFETIGETTILELLGRIGTTPKPTESTE